jgi:hypothetical protein
MMFRFPLKALWLGLAGLAAAGSIQAVGFQPAVLLDARGSFEDESLPGTGRNPQTGADTGQLLVVPGFTFGDKTSLLPLVGVLASGSSVAIDENSFFTQSYTFIARPQLRRVLNPTWALDVFGLANDALNQQSTNEPLGTDFYDYEEYGGGLGLEMKSTLSWLSKTQLSASWVHRHYPNWRELAANLTGNQNYYDKDYQGPKVSWTLTGPGGPKTWNLELDWQHKAYTDGLLVSPIDGTFELDTERVDDWVHGEGGLQGVISPALAWGFMVSADDNASNQNYFDTLNGNVVVTNFYSYSSVQAGPTLTWKPAAVPESFVTASASLLSRNYGGRRIRGLDGSWANGLQSDFEQVYGLDSRWPLWRGIALVGGLSYDLVQSNSQFAYGYQPNYAILQTDLGLHYQY